MRPAVKRHGGRCHYFVDGFRPLYRALVVGRGTNMQIFTKAKHVSDDGLGLHALDDLTESDRQPVACHLARCPHCRRRFEEVREFVSFLRLAAATQAAERPYVIH